VGLDVVVVENGDAAPFTSPSPSPFTSTARVAESCPLTWPRRSRIGITRIESRPMSAPQDSTARQHEKRRRRRKLAKWRAKQAEKAAQALAKK
jgi:hypothetical protein